MNDWTINVRVENSHLVADLSGYLMLIDTGSPTSFGEVCIEWDGEGVDLRELPLRFSLETLRKHVGLDLKGLIGCDLLFKRGLRLDVPKGLLTLQNDVACDDDSMKLDSLMGVPMTTINIVGEVTRVAIDTGAMQTFLRDHVSDGRPRVGTVEDFSPFVGEFTVELVEMRADIGGQSYAITPAIIPPVLETLLRSMSINGIIGLDILQRCVFDFATTESRISPHVEITF